MTPDTIVQGDALFELRKMPSDSVHCAITSPPYFGLRDYGHKEQIGLEGTPEAYVEKLVQIFREVRRILRPDGTLWLNIGDSYASDGSGGHGTTGGRDKSTLSGGLPPVGSAPTSRRVPCGMKRKDLIGIPWMLAFALRSDGWFLRQDIIWHKPNPMPESVTDRCTRAHEYVFMLSRCDMYYYDASSIRTEARDPDDDIRRLAQQKARNKSNPSQTRNGLRPRTDKQRGHSRRHAGFNERWDKMSGTEQRALGANRRSVWTVATTPFKEAHFATFPEKLVEPMILAGCPRGGVVLDPFMGAGTTALVAKKLGRHFYGIELNPEYVHLAEKRIDSIPNPLFY